MRHDFILFMVLLLGSADALVQTPALRVQAGGRTVQLEAASLANLPRHTVETTDAGQAVRFEGVRLADVLAQAGVTFGQTMRGSRVVGARCAGARDSQRTGPLETNHLPWPW